MMESASQNHERAIVIADTSRYVIKSDNDIGKLSLSQFPDELILEILSYLDVDDLLNASRLSHHLRTLSLDPLLHAHRLHDASHTLSRRLSHRAPLTDLMSQRIYITRTSLAARSLGRNFIKIKLNKQLGQRPSIETLVEKNVLPKECYGHRKLAPGLVGIKRKVERERVKDGLRAWVEGWKGRVGERRERLRDEGGKVEVRWLVRRFARRDGNESGGEGRGEEG
ncbi:57f15b97-ce17-4af4-b527-638848163d73 [Sclerotinia trifoliorum]|uniref:57f15b97-ce17-4af4-b527-638848163d73 n=1 Tax=Sclerotinia trifoliorum TaxID=28548 RepID=A0A8H2VXV4_9HELO|nr:57f15b97-ce17-4af4-b527-638848163d73 [Sclerotinia trifoliorum]